MHATTNHRDLSAQFTREIATHALQVIRQDGVHRHLRFKRPGTMVMHFDLLTWPGYLCFTGDMGTFVFRRQNDMLEFFRRSSSSAPHQPDLRYWAEKLESVDRCDGVKAWSMDVFRTEVIDHFEQATVDDERWPPARKQALRREIEERVLAAAECNEHRAWSALTEFSHDGFRFRDWESDCTAWSHRFVWCCHALEWAIGIYDATTAGDTVSDTVSDAVGAISRAT